jgi:hypothetical protein
MRGRQAGEQVDLRQDLERGLAREVVVLRGRLRNGRSVPRASRKRKKARRRAEPSMTPLDQPWISPGSALDQIN